MFDGRIYRAAFVPLLFVLVIAGFSLESRSGPLRSTLAPDAFSAAHAFAGLQTLVKRFPDRRPGSLGDDRLAKYIADTLRGLGGLPGQAPVGGGFQVSFHRLSARTIDGSRTLTTVIAERSGSTGMSPIAIVAHRDAAGRASAAELSGTATMLELARVFSQSETRRTILLVSTSGGSGGDAGAVDFAQHAPRPLDAAIVLGDLAGSRVHKPFVLPFSSTLSGAPESLQMTLDAAISQQVGGDAGSLSAATQLAHLAFPLASGEQASMNAEGVPSVLVQVSGEPGPLPDEGVSATRLLNFGRAVLGATYALDEGPDVAQSSGERVVLGHKALPGWTVRLLALALLLPPLLVSVDALARLRRRREPISRWIPWVLSGALPFFLCALFAMLLGALGFVAAPGAQAPAVGVGADGSAPLAVVSTTIVLVLALLAWPALVRRFMASLRPSSDGAALVVMLVLLAVALWAWIVNPFACLLLVPALHLWLPAAGGGRRGDGRGRPLMVCAILLGLLPLLLLLIGYAHELGLGAGGLSASAVLILAGGHVGPFGALAWSMALGCVLTMLMLTQAPAPANGEHPEEWMEMSTRGPASYAGPGSLGGTESALRR